MAAVTWKLCRAGHSGWPAEGCEMMLAAGQSEARRVTGVAAETTTPEAGAMHSVVAQFPDRGPGAEASGVSEPRDPGGSCGRCSPSRVPSGCAFCHGETHGQPQSRGRRIRPPLSIEFLGILNLCHSSAQLSLARQRFL